MSEEKEKEYGETKNMVGKGRLEEEKRFLKKIKERLANDPEFRRKVVELWEELEIEGIMKSVEEEVEKDVRSSKNENS